MSAPFAEAARLTPQNRLGYALAYGSHATGAARARSDLDLLYTGRAWLSPARLGRLITEVKRLHWRHGLDLDEEVPYQVKLYAAWSVVEEAVLLGGFAHGPHVPETVRETTWLSTPEFTQRLVLNVLTTPHVFLAGDVTVYRQHVATAERAAALLALRLAVGPVTVTQACAALCSAPDGRAGKDFLGYTPGPHLVSVVGRGLAELTSRAEAVEAPDGAFRVTTAIRAGG